MNAFISKVASRGDNPAVQGWWAAFLVVVAPPNTGLVNIIVICCGTNVKTVSCVRLNTKS
ncbi:hypothetical protein SAMN04488072_104191 [Lentibacillus halodurans]|uniref:Uncharacterized protein n=1 Tax=Lentibacillus halodurans TaxID=237679 RepID=A0A1I0X8Y6_9BACI|nr:hypothetical protein SAMN04488072_104191 [Lentibacillus halodurans]